MRDEERKREMIFCAPQFYSQISTFTVPERETERKIEAKDGQREREKQINSE